MVGILAGILIGQRQSQPPRNVLAASEEAKFAKEYKEQVVIKTIRENAKEIQQCYLDLLSKNPTIKEGSLTVLFKIEEDGEISSARITKNDFNDSMMAECVSTKLTSYYFAPPPIGINRYISHVLSFKTEETVKKEALERAEKSKLPKVLPIGP